MGTKELEIMDSPILITGCARSGTSMTAGIIDACGAFGGKMAGPTRYNAKGMFENTVIRNDIVKPFLRLIKADPLGQYPLPVIDKVKQIASDPNTAREWKDKIASIIRRQGYREGVQWFYKGAKMCLFWPLWVEAFPKARWVIVRRNADEIINSCLRTGFMRAFDNAGGWQWWVEEHEKRFDEMESYTDYTIWPEKMIGGDFSEIKTMIDGLELNWQEDKVRNFIAPALWNKRR